MGFFDKKIAVFEKKIEGKNAKEWGDIGENKKIYHQNYDEAIEAFNKAIELDPNNIDIMGRKADCLFRMNRFEDSIVVYNKAIELEPKFAYLIVGKARCFNNLQKYSEELKLYDQVIRLEPDSSQGYMGKMYALSNLKKNKELIDFFDNPATLKFLDNSYSWRQKADALKNLGRFDEAVQAYEKAIDWHIKEENERKKRPYFKPIGKYDLMHYFLEKDKADTLKDLKQWDEAIESYDEAIDICNGEPSSDVWYKKAIIYKELKDFSNALGCCNGALNDLKREEARYPTDDVKKQCKEKTNEIKQFKKEILELQRKDDEDKETSKAPIINISGGRDVHIGNKIEMGDITNIKTKISDSVVQRSTIGAKGNIDDNKCPDCGAELNGRERFCPECGQNVR